MKSIKVLILTLTLFSFMNCSLQNLESEKDKIFNQNTYLNEREIIDYTDYNDSSHMMNELTNNVKSIIEFSTKKIKSSYSYPKIIKKYNRQGNITEYLHLTKSKDTFDYKKYIYLKDTIKGFHKDDSVISIYKDSKLIHSKMKTNMNLVYKFEYEYDNSGRLIEKKQYISSENNSGLSHYIYKYNENKTLKFKINSTINNKQDTTLVKTFLFDNNGRMKKEIVGVGRYAEVIEERTYDVNGNIIKIIKDSGGGKFTIKNTYNGNLLLTSYIYDYKGLERKLEYEYNNDGNIITFKTYIADVFRTSYPIMLSYIFEYNRKGNLIDMYYHLRGLVVHREIKYW